MKYFGSFNIENFKLCIYFYVDLNFGSFLGGLPGHFGPLRPASVKNFKKQQIIKLWEIYFSVIFCELFGSFGSLGVVNVENEDNYKQDL